MLRGHGPFLLQLNDVGSTGLDGPLFETPHGASITSRVATVPHWVYEVGKRPGGNPFAGMVTLGRAANNDIVVESPVLSKFHASFTRLEVGWTITDASQNGTWIDGERLDTRRPAPIGPGMTIDVAHTILFLFLVRDALIEHLDLSRKLVTREASSP